MAKKRIDTDTLNPITREDDDGGIKVTLPDSVRGNLRLMRRIHHRVVDIMADYGFVDFLVHDVEARLGILSADITCDFVKDLIREARAQGKEAGRG